MDDMTTPASAESGRSPPRASREQIMTLYREKNSSESDTPPAVSATASPHKGKAVRMIRIAINVAAFEAIARTLPLGSVGYEAEANERGERYVVTPPVGPCAGRARATARGVA